jgi:3-oxoacyl-[acyl-carrier protein] reductase
MELSLKGKTALVCGSTQGIGLATAIELALAGATCILLARNEARLKEAISQLDASAGQEHGFIIADFADPISVEEAVAPLIATGPIHILVNNTGGPESGPIADAKPEAFTAAFQQHLICNHILAQAVIPGMKEAGYGRILNIISTSVKAPIKNLGVSNTTRWAVAAWSKTLAGELAPFGITVNNVLPGSTNTGRLKAMFVANAKAKNITPEEEEQLWLNEIPMKRFGEASEIAALIAFLASPAAGYITGTSTAVDGGKTPVS